MSHLEYPNLAKISDFPERGLNYSGIILDGWSDGPNLYVHLSMLLISLMLGGLPRKGTRLESFWLLLNIIIIHPMDLFVGGFGVGPKYLVDEFAVLDTRYWVLKDPLVAWICYAEFSIMMPLELLWYVALQKRSWSRHYWAIITGTFQLVGTVFYMGVEASEGFVNLVGVDWPPKFDSYLTLKYFWFIFIFLNSIWIVIPLFFYYQVYISLSNVLRKYKLH